MHILLSSAQYNKNDSIYNAQRTTPNIEPYFDLLEEAMQEEFLTALFGEAIDKDDGDYPLELAHLPVKYSGLALLKNSQFRNAESPSM